MREVRLLSAVKTDQPFSICGDAGAVVRVHESAAVFLVKQQLGEYTGPEDPGVTRAQLEREEAEIKAGASQAATDEDISQDAPDEEPEEQAEKEPPKRPYGNAPKSAWIRYACAVDPDLTQERAEMATKGELMSKYGERL